ncbi:MAG: hypothetical protein ACXVGB_00260 [Mycobacteriaceae bacterium]
MMYDAPNTEYQHRKARREAQALADRVGHRVTLQVLTAWRSYQDTSAPGSRVTFDIRHDRRGPGYLGIPWRTFYPTITEQD